MKLTQLAEQAEAMGLELSLQRVKTDGEGNILSIVVEEPGRSIFEGEGYLFNSEPEEDRLFEYVPNNELRDSFIDEQLRAIRDAERAGEESSAELIERLISIAASLQESIKFYRAELEAVEEQI